MKEHNLLLSIVGRETSRTYTATFNPENDVLDSYFRCVSAKYIEELQHSIATLEFLRDLVHRGVWLAGRFDSMFA